MTSTSGPGSSGSRAVKRRAVRTCVQPHCRRHERDELRRGGVVEVDGDLAEERQRHVRQRPAAAGRQPDADHPRLAEHRPQRLARQAEAT